MKKVILGLGLMLASTTAFADCSQIDKINGLDQETKQEMKVSCEQKKLDMVSASTQASNTAQSIGDKLSDPVILSEWGQVAQEFAKALGIAAQEMGIAANDFLNTPAGKITAALIIWHVAGESLIGIAIGVPMLIVIWILGVKCIRSLYRSKVTYSKERTWYGARIKETEKFPEFTDGMAWVFALSMVGMLLGSWIILENMIY